MYSLNVREHFMIAHSFQGAVFGPAQSLHGATYIVDLEMRRPALDTDGLVVDIGLASQCLASVLAEFNFKNLDEVGEFTGKNTTTEFMARVIFDRIVDLIKAGDMGAAANGLTSMKVTLHESHVAWAAFEGDVK
ncbi:MAG: 6-carboxytetrahydropterin synthase [Granulosicoccus sp.]|nr:6-carboxytetrahydropterin synthase [Granulosicoccus sp.]